MKRAKKGFTLIEVICVLVIIAIIAAIAVPNISGYIKKSKQRNCESVMTNFVNDLEYKIVSKRFYDVNDLNDEMVGVAELYANEVTKSENSDTYTLKGICPNHGEYNVSWTITADSPNITDNLIYSATVYIDRCCCSCLEGEDQVEIDVEHEFKAALINYSETEVSPLQRLLSAVQAENPNSAILPVVVDSVNSASSLYQVAGVTVNNKGEIEWISIYLQTDMADGNEKYEFITLSKGQEVETFLTQEEFTDISMWPPAEGTEGSAGYKQYTLNTDNNVMSGYSFKIAGLDETVNTGDNDKPYKVEWIQREGNWYVQKNSTVKGIDFTVPEIYGNETDENYNSRASVLTNNDTVIQDNSLPLYSSRKNEEKYTAENLKQDLRIKVNYENGSFAEFGHLEVSGNLKNESGEYELSDDYTVKNGFVFVDSDNQPVSWAGVFDSAANGIKENEKNNLESIIKNEDSLVNDFLKNISDGTEAVLTVAYQEYLKTYNADTRTYSYNPVPVTCYARLKVSDNAEFEPGDTSDIQVNSGIAKIPVTVPAAVNDSETEKVYITIYIDKDISELPYEYDREREEEIVINDENNTITVPVTKEVPISDNRTVTVKTTVTLPLFEQGDTIKIGDEVVASLEYDETQTGYDVEYKQTSSVFTVDDIHVYQTVSCTVTAGSISKDVSSRTEIKHAVENDKSTVGFYIGNYNGYSRENEEKLVKSINNSANYTSWIFLINTPSENKYYNDENAFPLISLFTGINTPGWDYEYTDGEKELYMENFDVTVSHSLSLGNVSSTKYPNVSLNGEGIITTNLEHKDSANKAGYYLSDNSNAAWVSEEAEKILIDKVNYRSAKMYLNYCTESGGQPNNVCMVNNTLESIKAEYDNKNSAGFSYSSLAATAYYNIEVKNNDWDNSPKAKIGHSLPLEHHTRPESSDPDLIYYLASSENKGLMNIVNVSEAEPHVLSSLNNNNANTLYYVVYSDDKVVWDDIYVNTEASINPPDVVYLKENANTANVIAYLGVSGNIEIESEYTGYWSETEPDGSEPYVEMQGNNNAYTYYYIDDGKEYSINRVGKADPEAGPANVNDTVKFYNVKKDNSNTAVLDSVVIKEGIKQIGSYAFYDIKLNENGSLTVPGSVEQIGDSAFEKFGYIGWVNDPVTNQNIEVSNLTRITLGTESPDENGEISAASNLKTIGKSAFSYCFNLSANDEFIIPSGVTSIGDNAFYHFGIPDGTLVINGASDKKEIPEADKENQTPGTVRAAVIDGKTYELSLSKRIFGYKYNGDKKLTVKSLTIGGSVEVINDELFSFNTGSKDNPNYISTIELTGGSDAYLELAGNINTIGSYSFTKIGLTDNLVLGDSIEFIGNNAFEGLDSYSGSLDLSDKNIQTIGSRAFSGWSKVTGDLVIPASVHRIGEYAFDGFASDSTETVNSDGTFANKYGALTILGASDGAGGIGAGIFTNAHFRDITIGSADAAVTKISGRAFKNSPLNGAMPYKNLKGILKIGNSVTEIGLAAFENCSGLSGALTLSDSLTSIGDAAFSGCLGFTDNLVIPENVTTIGSKAFTGCGFNGSLTLNDSLERIGMEAFSNCKNFKYGLRIPESVTKGIGSCAFENFAANVNNTEQQGVLRIEAGSTSDGHEIGAFIFSGSRFNGIEIGGIVNKIGKDAFHQSVESSNDSVKDYVKVSDDSYVTDENITSIGEKTPDVMKADYSGISGSLVIEKSVTDIEDYAFYDFSTLTGTPVFNAVYDNQKKIYTSDRTEGVTHLGEGAFRGCRGFSGELFIPDTVDDIESCAFKLYGNGNCSLKIYGGSTGTVLGALKTKDNGTQETYHMIFPSSVFTNVTIGGKVTEISPQFMNNNLLAFLEDIENAKGNTLEDWFKETYDYKGIGGTLTIEDSVTKIGECAFKECNFTGDINLQSVNYIGKEAFDGCSKIDGNLSVPNVQIIGNSAFRNCSSMKGDAVSGDLTLTHIEQIGISAFENCSGITGQLFLNPTNVSENKKTGITRIGEKAFYNCSGFTGNLTIPNTITDGIGNQAFAYFGSSGNRGVLTVNSGSVSSGNGTVATVLGGKDTNIFEYANFGGVSVGGNVVTIADSFMNNYDESKKELNGGIGDRYSNITGNLTIGDSVVTIEGDAFTCCKSFDGELTIGNHVTSIGHDAFNSFNKAVNGLTIPSSVETIGKDAFKHFAQDITDGSRIGDLVINGSTGKDSDGTRTLDEKRFHFGQYKNVIVGDAAGVIKAGFMDNSKPETFMVYDAESESYQSRNLTGYHNFRGKLTIGENVKKIESRAFYGCGAFNEIALNNKLDTIEDDAFNRCSGVTGSFTIPESVTYIGRCAFKYFGNYASVTILGGSDGTVLGNKSRTTSESVDPIFPSARIKNLTVGGNVTEIYEGLFNNYDNHYVTGTDENGNTTYKINDTYCYDNIKGDLVFGDSVTVIGKNAFWNCDGFDGKLELGSKVQSIGESAFSGCTNLYSSYTPETQEEKEIGQGILKIPSTVISIGVNAFKSVCSSVNDSDKYPKLIVNGISSSEYNETARKNVGVIGKDIFNDANFRNVEFGGSVNKIANEAFMWYKQLRGSLVFRDNVEEVGNNAFQECGFDGELKLGNVSTIKGNAFHKCYSLYSTVENGKLEIPVSMNRINYYAFGEVCSQTPESRWPELVIKGGSVDSGKTLEGPLFNQAHFRNVTIGGKITSIKAGAFNNTGNYNSAGKEVIYYDNLKGNLVIEDSVKTIGDNAFKGCGGFDGHLTLGTNSDETKGLQSIGASAFEGCTSFSSVYSEVSKRKIELNIPASVRKIGAKAFESFGLNAADSGWLVADGYSSDSLVTKTVAGTSNNVKLLQANLFNHARFEGVSVGWNVTGIEEGFMKHGGDYDYSNISGDLYIGYNVFYIGKEAFSAENLPEGKGFNGKISFGYGESYDKEICEKAFYKQKFTGNLVFPYTYSWIDKEAFANCENLNGEIVFNNQMPESSQQGIKKIGEAAFRNCSGLTGDLFIPCNVSRIEDSAFENCSSLNGTLTLEDNYGTGAEYIGDSAFSGCSKLSGKLVIPATVKEIGQMAFFNDYGFTEFQFFHGINNNLESIGKQAFKNCSNMTGELWIMNTVKNVGDDAFTNCSKLTSIKIDAQLDKIGNGVFNNCSGLKGTLTIPSSVTSIGYYAFYNCSGLTGNLTIPSKVTTINSYAFSKCSGFNGTITIPSGVTAIGEYAFNQCSSLTGSLSLPSSLTTLESHVFNNCSKLSGNLTLPSNVTSVGDYAFNNCWSFTGTLTIPSGVKTIGDHAFFNCAGITQLNLNQSVNSIGSYAFADIKYANNGITIPNTVTSIGEHAFQNFGINGTTAGSLVINGGSNDTELGHVQIFDGAKFVNMTIGGSVRSISANAFNNSQHDYDNITGTLRIISGSVGFDGTYSNILGTKRPKYIYNSIGEGAFSETMFGNAVFPNDYKVLDNIYNDLNKEYGSGDKKKSIFGSRSGSITVTS